MSSKQPMLLLCCSFYPLSSDLIEMISFSRSFPRTPHAPRPVLARLSVIFSHQIQNIPANFPSQGLSCYCLWRRGVAYSRWLSRQQQLDTVDTKPQDGVQMCRDCDIGHWGGSGHPTWSPPPLPRPSWVSVRTFKIHLNPNLTRLTSQ